MLTHLQTGNFNREYRTQATGSGGETVATYLNKRLKQIGVSHVFCIPGDYLAEWAMTLDDPQQNAGLIRVHPNNEMCATYSADGYGRATNQTIGCVAFTYGAGGINAAQAVAGAFVEQVPVVVINGSPSVAQFNSLRDQGVLYHHMVNNSHTDQRIFSEITELTVKIDNPATAPALIDVALQTCLTTRRPVYIELTSQTAHMPCQAVPATELRASLTPSAPASVCEACAAVMAHLSKAKRAVVVGGSEIARYGLQEKFAALLKLIQAPYATSPLGKSVLCELRTDVSFAGVYFGKSSQSNLQQLLESADCVLSLGVRDTDFNYLGVVTPNYTPPEPDLPGAELPEPKLPGPDHIQARNGAVLVGRKLAYWGDVNLEALLDALLVALEKLPNQRLPGAPFPRLEGSASEIPPMSEFADAKPISYDSFKSIFNYNFFQGREKKTQIIADSGFSFLSNIGLQCTESGYIAQLAWGAVGYGVGAISGVTLANQIVGRARRTVAITGDAAFAEALNALGTVAQLGQDAIIFVMDNRVFAVEQWLIDANAFCPENGTPFAALTDVPQGHIWDYVKLAEGFGGKGYLVKTNGELKKLMKELSKEDPPINNVTKKPTFTLVAVRLPKNDLPSNAVWKRQCTHPATPPSEGKKVTLS